jgi:hypothetical protein
VSSIVTVTFFIAGALPSQSVSGLACCGMRDRSS